MEGYPSKLQGGSVLSLQIRFALDWNYAVGENLFKKMTYFCEDEDGACLYNMGVVDMNQTEKKLGIQIIASGPDARSRQIRIIISGCFPKQSIIFTFRHLILFLMMRCFLPSGLLPDPE